MNEPLRTRKTKLEWLLSPWTLLFCLTAGALTGINFPQAADRLALAGDSYLNLLQMCVLPIMITAVISSVARLLSSQMTGKVLGRLIGVFCLGLLMASGIGLTAGLVGKPGQDLDQKSKEAMGTLITSSTENEGHIFAPDMELFLEEDGSQDLKKTDFLQQIFPKNIFDALQKGHTLQIVFFSLLLGTALSFIPAKLRDQLLDSLDAVFQAFLLIIHWLMYLLPLGLF
ncbi:MAG: dicarboxylate/amino acid:cation symporter, partial [Desulfovermiculus sp.]